MNIQEIKKKNLQSLSFKENMEIYNRIQKLQNIKCNYTIGDIVKISATPDEKFQDEILKIALSLRPWRKGPFEIFNTFIDSEWQSFIKFNILKPHLDLKNKIVGDIGCNNCYYLFRMLKSGAKKLVGFDPSVHTYMQFLFLDKFIQSDIVYELLGVEHLPFYEYKFDTLFCLGVLYHRSDPIKTLKELKQSLNPKGELYLDTMYIDMEGEIALTPKNRYCKIPNIYFIPTIKALQNWCERAKFKDFEILATKPTDETEQRKTMWIYGESLNDFLDPNDKTKTIEGYPAPKRVYVRVRI